MGNLQKSTIFGRAKTMVSCQKMVNIRSFTWPGRVNQGKKPGFSLDIYIYTKTQQNIENTQLNQAIDMDL
jgi:hypothetical protein